MKSLMKNILVLNQQTLLITFEEIEKSKEGDLTLSSFKFKKLR